MQTTNVQANIVNDDDDKNKANNSVLSSDGYLVTQKYDPNTFDKSKIDDDLEALNKAQYGSFDPAMPREHEMRPELPTEDRPQELIALGLRNPFRGV